MADACDLYGLPREQFVTERGALAKSLRAEGDREEAASVARRRKPSVAAWAVNQLVRTQDRAVAALFQAGDALLHAQAELLAGRADAGALREAVERERAAVDELVNVSRGLLSTNGYELSQAMLERVSATLHAAALSEDARETVRHGCLDRELRYAGFGTTEALDAPAQGTPAKRTRAKPRTAQARSGAKREAKGPDRAERTEGRRAERRRAEKLSRAREAEADARLVARRADAELEAAQERRDEVASELRGAEEALDKARERAEAAARSHRLRRQALDAAGDQ